MKKTYQPKAKEIKRKWHLIDARGQILGRLSTQVAGILMGKAKATYSRHMDMGDCVVLINAKDIEVTGKKESQKKYVRHSGYPGGYKKIKYAKLLAESPQRIIEHSVFGMLPGNRLRDKRMRRLRVFAGSKHPYGDKFGLKDDQPQVGK